MDVTSSTRNQPVQAVEPSKRTTDLQAAQQQQTQASSDPDDTLSKSTPVINTLGQTTGQLLNVTA